MVKILARATHHTVEYGDFDIYVVKDAEMEHIVLTRGDIQGKNNVLCRVSSECLPGTALFSAECDCKQQIQFALERISAENQGIFIYLRQEGRGHGLVTKIRALANKNKGMDTFEAVESLGLPADVRHYGIVKDILDYFHIQSVIMICNNPGKLASMKDEGIVICGIVNTPAVPNQYSYRHLSAKITRGHHIQLWEHG